MKLVLLGAAGSGKGTLAKSIVKDFNIPQLSTGDLLREVAKSGSDLGKEVGQYQQNGVLVPDEVTFKVLKERLAKDDCKNGFILDGYPRTLNQAKLLETIVDIDAVISIELEFDEIVKRLVSRRNCPNCGEIDNTEHEGYTGNCRKCKTPLFQRDDDKPETIKTRLEVYKNNITPLINFYGDKVFKISSANSPSETYKPVKLFLERLQNE